MARYIGPQDHVYITGLTLIILFCFFKKKKRNVIINQAKAKEALLRIPQA